MALFLVWHDGDGAVAADLALGLERFELCPGLILVDSDLDLSPLYHRIKWALPPDTALLVAPLADAPKFRGRRAEVGAGTGRGRRRAGGGSRDGWRRKGSVGNDRSGRHDRCVHLYIRTF